MSKANELRGGCLCGAVRFTCTASASRVSYCHCRMCQKATGGPFSVMANFREDAVVWQGEPAMWRSSPLAVRGYCRECGTPLSFQYNDSEHISLSVGAFDEPAILRPVEHGGVESRLPWVGIDTELPSERCEDDPDYRRLIEQTGWTPPCVPVKRSD